MRKTGMVGLLVCMLVVMLCSGVSAVIGSRWVDSLQQRLDAASAGIEALSDMARWANQQGAYGYGLDKVDGADTIVVVNDNKTEEEMGKMDIIGVNVINVQWIKDYNPTTVGFMTIIQGIPITIPAASEPEDYYANIHNLLSTHFVGTSNYFTEVTDLIFIATDPFMQDYIATTF